MSIKRGLGRGLNELLSGLNQPILVEENSANEQLRLGVEKLQPGKYQPRKDMDYEALTELADSIRAQGIIQPIIVRPIGENRYEIIAGERRWRAAQMAELYEVPVVVRNISDEAAVAMSLIENIQREDLNAIEEAVALQRLGEEFHLTHEAIASAVGKSRATISNLLRLLHLNPDVRVLVEHGDLEMGHARALLGLHGEAQTIAAQKVVAKSLSVRETEKLVQNWQAGTSDKTPRYLDPNIQQLQRDLSDKLGAKVAIQHSSRGKGKLLIQYNNLEELDGILEKIR